MNISALKNGFVNAKSKINNAMLVTSVALMTTPAFAATYNVTDLVDEFDDGEAPVGAMASASIELLIVRRIWKIIQRSI
uniref:Uncharacterized protein n=1 Tax=Dulem virus 62 TaxID=3145773 RepID=A0AAU8B474_9VIRU